MNALVTGGTGFIGSHLVRQLLESGATVRCLVRRTSSADRCEEYRQLGVHIVQADCESGKIPDVAFEGITHVFHLAGMTRARTLEDYHRGNVLVTKHLLHACARSGIRLQRFVFVSSLSAVGPAENGVPVTEQTPCHPVSEYGRSKYLAEQEVRAYARQLPIVIVRPSAVYGPGDRDLFSYFQLILNRIFPIVGDASQRVNLISWKDTVRAIMLAATSPAAIGQTYLIGDGSDHTTQQIGELIAQTVGTRPLRIRLPYGFAYLVSALSEVAGRLLHMPVFLNREKLRELVASAWTCSIDRAQRELRFQPSMTVEQGFRETYDWYRRVGWI